MKDLFDLIPNAQFSSELPADKEEKNYNRQVEGACYSFVETRSPSNPEIVHSSKELLEELLLKVEDEERFLKVMSGAEKFKDFKAFAMCYGGHQFGHWAGQLGDGRAINISEFEHEGKKFQLQLKGAGPTPYSRKADGLAVLRSSIREYLCSEAMHQLGVPTTRALSLVKSGDLVPRDMLYDGNNKDELGAIVCRVAPSFIRFGSFEIFASRKDSATLKELVDYTIKHHFTHLEGSSKKTYLSFFKEVVERTKSLILEWQRVGFVHGVMNTDNLSILGLTIDYGPYGWLENYDPEWTPNTTDVQHKRYRFGNQAQIGLWNLLQLANALYPLIQEAEPLQKILDEYKSGYLLGYHEMMCAKLGLYQVDLVPVKLIDEVSDQMKASEADMTLFFRELSSKEMQEFEQFWKIIEEVSYLDKSELRLQQENWKSIHKQLMSRIKAEGVEPKERETRMKAINPKYVLRNYMAQMAIDAAERGDNGLVDELYQLLLKPYHEQPEMDKWYAKRPEWAKHKVGCSMLSCSS
ncbi:MAG: YdiU family protein [Flavobacteriales bacterium]|nr:YdiU family protein [Flavobacteriales bacterium]